jgi:segregation and condensation protein B
MNIEKNVEAILFVASKPLPYKKIATSLGVSDAHIRDAIDALVQQYRKRNAGLDIICTGTKVHMVSHSSCTEVVSEFTKDEVSGDLTKAQLETLTVIAYRSPVTRAELEHIRGVNCAVILRNLLMRGLIDMDGDVQDPETAYALSSRAMAHLGLSNPQSLTSYAELHAHEHVERLLE